MLETREIPYLLRLLDDESPEIRESVLKELDSFGCSLEDVLVDFDDLLDAPSLKILTPLLEKHRRKRIKRDGLDWLNLENDYKQLEAAYNIIADFQFGRTHSMTLGPELDRLSEEYMENYSAKNVFQLAEFLFDKTGLQGARSNYHNPKNSNLVCVLSEKRGIPISLVSIYMLVGYRLGLNIEGCDFPGHFLARTRSDGRLYWVDCFDRGSFIKEEDIFSMLPAPSLDHYNSLHQSVSAPTIIERVLRNLIRAYQLTGERKNASFILELLQTLTNETVEPERAIRSTKHNDNSVKARQFAVGELVKHKRYGYRGVIVDANAFCQADDLWFHSNQTQPDRDQRWYHVLVHNASHTTYAAQSNLLHDNTDQPIEHPLLDAFFSGFDNGVYIRNETPWSG